MVLDSKDKYIKVSDKYNLAKASLDGLQQAINSLRVNNHENKNQLSVIRTMILKGDKGVSKYIDALMEDRIAQDEALMKETDNISNSAIGSILYSKMLHMKGQNIDAYLHVDKKIKVTDLIDLDENTVVDICKIIGVFLDNAIQAVSNLERKIVKVDIVMDEYQKINITIMNNYNGIIEPSKIGKMGYSTKGHGHGYGLSLVKNIVESNKELSTERSIYNDIFTQTLVINIKKNKKTSMQDT